MQCIVGIMASFQGQNSVWGIGWGGLGFRKKKCKERTANKSKTHTSSLIKHFEEDVHQVFDEVNTNTSSTVIYLLFVRAAYIHNLSQHPS